MTTTQQYHDAFQNEVGEWANATFPNSDSTSIMGRLCDETEELRRVVFEDGDEFDTRPSTDAEIKEEAADCLMLLLHLSHKMGFSLFEAAQEKFEINQQRTWETEAGEKGYWKHR